MPVCILPVRSRENQAGFHKQTRASASATASRWTLRRTQAAHRCSAFYRKAAPRMARSVMTAQSASPSTSRIPPSHARPKARPRRARRAYTWPNSACVRTRATQAPARPTPVPCTHGANPPQPRHAYPFGFTWPRPHLRPVALVSSPEAARAAAAGRPAPSAATRCRP